tara:strand:+ start:2960 stop:3889 length:930 start_codon:yes stop_codon:yes gene_type:complete
MEQVMKIAIFGANSQIAKDTILFFLNKKEIKLFLFARNIVSLEKWLINSKLDNNCKFFEYSSFSNNQKFNVIINFVGVGDPEKIKISGNDIFKITEKFDEMAIEYLKENKGTKYIFLSSGAVYSSNYQEPVSKDTVAKININNLISSDWYAIAKIYAEAKHRSLVDYSIVDIRVFNYFSHTQDMSARFLITDIVRSLKNKEILETSSDNIVRDYITPIDFNNLIKLIINYKPLNTALDCYTKSPISKFDLLLELESKFGLNYRIDESAVIINSTGFKSHYYSVNKKAKNIGYSPRNNSLDGIIHELNKL